MSVHATSHVLRLFTRPEFRDLPGIDCHVALHVAERHNDDYHMAWPTQDRIVAETHWRLRAVQNALERLAQHDPPVLFIDFGPLPKQRATDPDRQGNRYRFPGLDPIPEGEPRRHHAWPLGKSRRAAPEPEEPAPEQAALPASEGNAPGAYAPIGDSAVDKSLGKTPGICTSGPEEMHVTHGGNARGDVEEMHRVRSLVTEVKPAVRTGNEPAAGVARAARARDGHCSLCGNVVNTDGDGHRAWPRKARCQAFGLTIEQVEEAIVLAQAVDDVEAATRAAAATPTPEKEPVHES